jgi:hypothetical protein
MVAIKRALEPYQRQKAKERQIHANPSGIKQDNNPSDNLSQGDKTRDIIAKFVEVGERTLKKAEEICYSSRTKSTKY